MIASHQALSTVARLALLSLASTVLAACAAPGSLAIDVESTSAGESTPDARIVNFTLRAENPTAEPLPVKRIDYALTLDGDRVFDGARLASVTVRPYESAIIELPVPIPTAAAPGASAQYTITGSARYIKPGAFRELLFDTRIYRSSASFAGSGVITFGTSD